MEIKKEFKQVENKTFKITTIEPKEEIFRNFKGMWIPKEIWINKNLTWMEKLFLTEINSLDNDLGCFASNNYFSDFFDLSKSRCSEIINSLIEKNYLTVNYEYENKEIKKRILKLNFDVFGKQTTLFGKGDLPYSENRRGYSEKAQDINISYTNNINNNNIYDDQKNDKKNKQNEKLLKLAQCESFDELWELTYDAYPSTCPIQKRNLGKNKKCKDKIIKLILNDYFTAEIIHFAIIMYLQEAKQSKTYLKNFITFLNNLDEPQAIDNKFIYDFKLEE